MRATINQEVSVVLYYNSRKQIALPHLIVWGNRSYYVGEIGFRHHIQQGKVLHHIFELVDQDRALWMRLNFDTQNLHWLLEVIGDGLTD